MNKKIYNVGMYIRLSREDDDKKIESESITNQRNIILEYINKSSEENFRLIDEYVDDGISGTTFDRPAFKRMIEDIESGRINCIITKDYSRLGRDYIESGKYLEKYFPQKNVRYIAILDNIDTLYDSPINDLSPFKAIFNDQYARDISKKVRRSVASKKRRGQFLGWKAIYGYKLDEKDRYKIVIDEEAAKIVRRIFKMAYEGKSCKEIADILSEEKIPIPSVYANLNRGRKSSNYGLWCSRTISEMLTNETYIGNLTQGRRRTINYKVKKEIRTPKEDWIIVKNNHEPIIDVETFNIVQSIYKKNTNQNKKSKQYLLKGFLYCEECGHSLSISYRSDNRAYTTCCYYQKYSKFKVCTPHTNNYYKIEKIILDELKTMCDKYINSDNFEKILKNSVEINKYKDNLLGEIKASELKIQQLIDNKKKMYFDKLNEVITIDEYKEYIEKIRYDIEQIKLRKKDLEKEVEQFNKKSNNVSYKDVIGMYLKMENPNRGLIASLIDKIMINNNKEITIIYKIKKPDKFMV